MAKFNSQKIRRFILILALLFFSGEIGYALGKNEVNLSWQNWKPQLSVINREPPPARSVNFKLFWDVWDQLSKDYIDKSKIIPQNMVYGAIQGMVRAVGDPYTVFLSPEENKAFKEDLTGATFGGIGAQLGMKGDQIVVIAPLKDSPAAKAGVRSGDVILQVDGADTSSWTLPEAVSKIRGVNGTKVTLTIGREKEKKPLEITIARDMIVVKSVDWESKTESTCQDASKCPKIAYLKLSVFGDDTVDWGKAVSEIRSQGGNFKGLALDLRDNPGGYLSGAVYIASEFLTEGTVVQQENSAGEKQTYTVNRKGELTNIPMVVLVNKGSASASEIVALALRDQGRAKLVGEKTFGKYTIQEAEELGGGAGLHVTTAKWLSPKGITSEGGIEPDVVVADDESDQTKDPQLDKAIEILLNSKS